MQGARVATAADHDRVTEIITLAFAEDPVWGRTLRKPGGQPEGMADFWRLWILGALRYPWVWLWNEGEAASVWIPPGGTEMSVEQEDALGTLAASKLGETGATYLARVIALFDANHPHGEAHYYLSLLATHPAHRGRGAGMALLADNLARIDAEGLPAYLESSNPANDHRYQRLAFQRIGHFTLPDDGPIVTTMWRAARGV
jgi:GNAT superfamily N-acetyltransferase